MSDIEGEKLASDAIQAEETERESVESNSEFATTSENNDIKNKEQEQDDDDDDGLGLFGDDDEEDEEDESKVSQQKLQAEDEDEDEEIEDKIREEDLKSLEISLVRHSKSHYKLKDETIKLQVPSYIGIETAPFDPKKFEESVQENAEGNSQQLDDKLLAENTIRWRYSTDKNDVVFRQSNTQIIEWEDGTYSLKLGSEIFDLRIKPNEDNFLVMTHDDQDILQTQEILTHVAKIVPTSTSSQVHKRLTKAIANKQAQNKKSKMKSIILTEDPELRIKALEKLEEESIKARRRAELKRLQEEEKFERGSPAPSRGTRSYYTADDQIDDDDDEEGDARKNEYDDDDGFIDDDDGDDDEDDGYGDEDEDELDKAAERLRKVKEAGAAKYSSSENKRSATPLTEEDDEDKVSRKKRRIISDDEDED